MAELYDSFTKALRDEPYAVGGIEGSLPFLKLIPPEKKRVLVIGCGEGHEVAWLVAAGHEAVGVTITKKEAETAKKKFGVEVKVADMHKLPKELGRFDAIFASNVLEHSVMPYLALLHWRNFLNKGGWLVLGMPSREWLSEYYHFSVLNRAQVKDLLYKSGYQLLAGPQMKPLIDYRGGDIFHDLGRKWGFTDGYVTRLSSLPKDKRMLGEVNTLKKVKGNILRTIVKWPYNKIRVWWARNFREW